MGDFRRLCVWMFLVSVWSSVICQDEVKGFVGESVLLPCFYNKSLPANVFWRDKNSNHVLNIENISPNTPSPKYEGRVHSFQDQYKNGNFSIIVTNLTLEDKGPYDCNIQDSGFKRINLNVSEKPAGPSGGAAGTNILHGVVLSAVCLLLCFLL